MTGTITHPKLCNRCILPAAFPGISFNQDGVCNHCQQYRGHAANKDLKGRYEEKFLSLLQEHRNPQTYDILMAYSGGKDSTYTLEVFVTRYKLRVLALTLDNSFMSPQAFINMQDVCNNLGVDHMVIRPSQKMLRTIFQVAATRELYSLKTLERASTICTSCIGIVKAVTLRTAIEKNIPFVGFGWSPGQAPVQASVMKTNSALMRIAQKAIFEPIYQIAGNSISPYFVTEEQFALPEKFPWNIHPLAFLEYDEKTIETRNREIGWIKPDDTDPNSTNCLLNAYANHIHKQRYDFHPYVWEIANMVRTGAMERQEGLEKIYSSENPDMVDFARRALQEV